MIHKIDLAKSLDIVYGGRPQTDEEHASYNK